MTIVKQLHGNCKKSLCQYDSSAKADADRTLQLESANPEESHTLLTLSNSGESSEEEKLYRGNADNSLYQTITHQPIFTTVREAYHGLPPDLRVLVEAVNYGLPDTYRVPFHDKPEWLDKEKFKLGQRFATKYLFGLTFCELTSLLMCGLVQDNVKTMMYSGNSSTSFTSYKRFLSTVLKINSWFEEDIWDKNSSGYRNLAAVRAMHFDVSRKINSESKKSLKVKLRKEAALRCPLFNDLREDFKSLRPALDCSPDSFRSPKLHFNQCDMSLTQFGFVGLMLVYPGKFGAKNASNEELEGFVHFWRVLGYYLGIDDRFNFCQGSLDEVKKRCENVIHLWFRPSFSSITREWEHMCRCLTEGVSYYVHGVSFELLLMYLCWVLGIHAPKLFFSLNWDQLIMFNIIRLTMCFLLRIPGVLALCNLFLRRLLDLTQNRPPGMK